MKSSGKVYRPQASCFGYAPADVRITMGLFDYTLLFNMDDVVPRAAFWVVFMHHGRLFVSVFFLFFHFFLSFHSFHSLCPSVSLSGGLQSPPVPPSPPRFYGWRWGGVEEEKMEEEEEEEEEEEQEEVVVSHGDGRGEWRGARAGGGLSL
ncbi:unnamed protein product [Arctogadus glacialis]